MNFMSLCFEQEDRLISVFLVRLDILVRSSPICRNFPQFYSLFIVVCYNNSSRSQFNYSFWIWIIRIWKIFLL